MKSSKSSIILNSFNDLKVLLEKKPFPLPQVSVDNPPHNSEVKQDPENELRLFKEATADVKPISRDNCREKNTKIILPDGPKNNSDAEILLQLSNLVNNGDGLVIADTPEYIEGTGYNVNPEITKRLHRGDFAIEAYIDLHGLNAKDAKEAFENFLKDTVRTGKKAVLIIHGRGLCSPAKPVIKTKVIEWLTRSPWRKWVIAYASARSCDGGTGATYVLLRRLPFPRRFRKRPKTNGKGGGKITLNKGSKGIASFM